MEYRREIDGLRALAVIPVMLFHAGFQAFSGGFVGVDVFFVISGYLITSIILAEKQAGTFTLIGFYERRARRILPALFVVMFTCLPFAWLWLPPEDMKSFSQSLVAVSAFASNILFWLTSGYFETAAELKPLLHTWSLAVEEQYYVLFPIFILLMWELGKRWIVSLLAAVAVISLAVAQWGSQTQISFTFFMLPTRGWEILVGAFIAFYFSEQRRTNHSQSGCQAGSVIGLLLISYAVFAFDKQTPSPSLLTLIPVIGAALITLFATQQTLVGKLLGSKLFVGVGLISYSAYLWHQPLLAFARHRSLDEPSKLLLSILVIAAVALAYLSWKYVETPFRNRQRFSRKQIILYSASFSIFFVGFGLTGQLKKGFESRLSDGERIIMSYATYAPREDVYRYRTCFLDLDQAYTEFSHLCTANSAVGGTFIWGDSHAAALSYGLRQSLQNVVQYTAAGCPPIKDAEVRFFPNCKKINDYVLSEIHRMKPIQVYLHANWTLFEEQNKEQESAKNIHKTIDYVRSVSPSTKITIVGGVPQWFPSLPANMLKKRMTMHAEQYVKSSNLNDLTASDNAFDDVAKEMGVNFFSAINALCVNDKCQATVVFNDVLMPTVWDYGHLTEGGSVLLAKKLIHN